MNKDIKKNWVDALRSGEYKQGTGELRKNEDHFCCLGVLCDLAAKDGVGEWKARNPYLGYYFDDTGKSNTHLPASVSNWAGLFLKTGEPDEDPTILYINEEGEEWERTLSEINDDGFNFSAIADIIEEQL